MELVIQPYTRDRIPDVLDFERRLRREEDVWGWEIDQAYVSAVEGSFDDRSFDDAISLLAYAEGAVVGRIDASLIASRFDGSKKGYLDMRGEKQQAPGGRPAASGRPTADIKGPGHRHAHSPDRRQRGGPALL